MNKRCLLLYSGGLDSVLSAFIMNSLGIEIILFKMVNPFSQRKVKDSRTPFLLHKIPTKLFNFYPDKDFLDVIKGPKFGYGSAINPCIDCKIYLLKKAKQFLSTFEASFIVTGEVVGQRDMSQHKWQIKRIEKEAGVEGLVLRPLSAKLLEETIPEKNKIVDRDKLYSISGKQRVRQIELAKSFGIVDISSSGGCLLSDKNYVLKIKQFFQNFKNYEVEDATLLKYGRHFHINNNGNIIKIILGKNEEENNILKSFYKETKFFLFEPDVPGPTALCYAYPVNNPDQKLSYNAIKIYAEELISNYSKTRHF